MTTKSRDETEFPERCPLCQKPMIWDISGVDGNIKGRWVCDDCDEPMDDAERYALLGAM